MLVSEEDWSLHRKGDQDQLRHQEKVKEAIKKNLPDLVSEESIILSDGKQVVKVPIRSMEEYRFRFNHNKNKQMGQGQGDTQVGDVVAKDGEPQKGSGKGQGAGEQAGEDYYEAEISMEELESILFAEMELPYLVQKEMDSITVEDTRFNDIRKTGLSGNIAKKRTLLEAIRRNGRLGNKGKPNISIDDLRYKTWEEITIPHSNAVVMAMMDTSGSMGMFEKYVARSFFFWMVRFLRTKYEKVEIVFIAHHTEAKEVSEEHFFTKGESGGTICSSAYRKALEIIDTRYPPSQFNIYSFHFSDGDNLTSDNQKCIGLVQELMKRSNIFGYGEVNQYNRHSTLMNAYRHVKDEKFLHYVIKEKGQVYQALKHFFAKTEDRK
ncbi:hypothetical protein SAMN04487866_11235 [Thermoactinomyces sp. DSM 45891]|uniref:sporulation protein YhbH n=1 Tax=Thermoactinomyces sp. DSM 45891 TaxID=1761907 RepID=UPI00090EF13B|nr:sporulation protein YhbH [Thermoactinomyces sp. DSM 45891]SFX57363.1 hypothetical protein SAMN04487866_11235 [Thermoactinomyces sp. DSM 45891]